VADSERLAEQALDEPSGTLRITAPLTFGTEKLAPALSEFTLLCPRVKLDVVLTNRRPDLLENGFDVAFRLGNTQETHLIARPLLDYNLTMCASPGVFGALKAHRKNLMICNTMTACPLPIRPGMTGSRWKNTGA